MSTKVKHTVSVRLDRDESMTFAELAALVGHWQAEDVPLSAVVSLFHGGIDADWETETEA